MYVHNLLRANWQEPWMTKNSSSSRAPKTGAQLRDDPEEREKCPTIHRRQNPEGHQTLAQSPLSLCTLEVHELQQKSQGTTCTNRDIDHNVSTATADAAVFCTDNPKHLSLDATGMSTALSKNCTCGSTPHKLATSTYRHDLWHWHTTICSPSVGTS